MTVYVVLKEEYGLPSGVSKVFSTRKKAEDYVNKRYNVGSGILIVSFIKEMEIE